MRDDGITYLLTALRVIKRGHRVRSYTTRPPARCDGSRQFRSAVSGLGFKQQESFQHGAVETGNNAVGRQTVQLCFMIDNVFYWLADSLIDCIVLIYIQLYSCKSV